MAICSWRRYVHQFGAIEGIEVGARYETRFDLKQSGLHVSDRSICHLQSGVVSVLVQKKYEDYGDLIKITICQKLRDMLYVPSTVKNFHASLESKAPVRVIRQPIGQYGPIIAYRYDGLYIIEKKTNSFDRNMLTLKHTFYLVRLPSQPQVYEDMPATGGVPELEMSQYRRKLKLEIPECSEGTLSNVD